MMQRAPKRPRFVMERNVCYAVAAFSFVLAIGGVAYDFAIREEDFALLWSVMLIIGGTGALRLAAWRESAT